MLDVKVEVPTERPRYKLHEIVQQNSKEFLFSDELEINHRRNYFTTDCACNWAS
jgi:hypothetical protein